MLSSAFVPIFGDLQQYIRKIQEFPLLSEEEELQSAKSWYERGVVSDAHKLVTSHLRLVVKVAVNFKNYGFPIIDLVMEGNLGLMQAVKKFNPFLGYRLSTYATWWIKASIKDYILKSWSLVKIGTTQAQRKLFFSLRKIKNKILKYSQNNDSLMKEDIAAIAEQCSVSQQEVVDMERRLSLRDCSLNQVISYDAERVSELQDSIASSTPNQESLYLLAEDQEIKNNLLREAISKLSDRSREIFINRRLLPKPKTLNELSKVYGMSAERVRQIENQALDSIKKFVESHRSKFGF